MKLKTVLIMSLIALMTIGAGTVFASALNNVTSVSFENVQRQSGEVHSEEGVGEHNSGTGESQDEHKRDINKGGEGEESGNKLALNETYDVVRKGARLIMNYDKKDNSFNGIVVNTTNNILKRVRVEVHLSNGLEIGPTTPVDLAPGEKLVVVILATNQTFDGWTPHAEVGAGEHNGSEN